MSKVLCGCPAFILSLSEAFTACLFRGYFAVHLLRRECGDWIVIVESSHNHLRAYSGVCSDRQSHSHLRLPCCLSVTSVGVTLRQWRLLRGSQSQSSCVNGPLVSQKASCGFLDIHAMCAQSRLHGYATAGL